MKSLFNNELYPITSTVAFIQADLDSIVKEFISWQTPLIANHNNTFETITIKEDLKDTLLSLCPLTTTERRRYLFIPTKNNWVAFFDNGHIGTDRTAPEILGQKLKSKVIYASLNNTTEENTFEYYDMLHDEFELIRSVAVIKESKWEFHQYGKPLTFEHPENYTIKPIKKRFTSEILLEYLNYLGIQADDENFYDTKKGAILLNKKGPKFENTKELDLNAAKSFFR